MIATVKDYDLKQAKTSIAYRILHEKHSQPYITDFVMYEIYGRFYFLDDGLMSVNNSSDDGLSFNYSVPKKNAKVSEIDFTFYRHYDWAAYELRKELRVYMMERINEEQSALSKILEIDESNGEDEFNEILDRELYLKCVSKGFNPNCWSNKIYSIGQVLDWLRSDKYIHIDVNDDYKSKSIKCVITNRLDESKPKTISRDWDESYSSKKKELKIEAIEYALNLIK